MRSAPSPTSTPPKRGIVDCHLGHCRTCQVLMLCEKLACSPQDHVCYVCAHVARQKVALALTEVTPA